MFPELCKKLEIKIACYPISYLFNSQSMCKTLGSKTGLEGVKWELGICLFRGWEMGFCALGTGFMKEKQ